MFKVIATHTYLKEIENWPKPDKEAVDKTAKNLAENPFIGEQMGYPFLREKGVRGNKIYYLIYKDLSFVFLVTATQKKDQKININHIREHLNEFRRVAEEISKKAF